MPIGDRDHRGIAVTVPGLLCRGDQALDFPVDQVLAGAALGMGVRSPLLEHRAEQFILPGLQDSLECLQQVSEPGGRGHCWVVQEAPSPRRSVCRFAAGLE